MAASSRARAMLAHQRATGVVARADSSRSDRRATTRAWASSAACDTRRITCRRRARPVPPRASTDQDRQCAAGARRSSARRPDRPADGPAFKQAHHAGMSASTAGRTRGRVCPPPTRLCHPPARRQSHPHALRRLGLQAEVERVVHIVHRKQPPVRGPAISVENNCKPHTRAMIAPSRASGPGHRATLRV